MNKKILMVALLINGCSSNAMPLQCPQKYQKERWSPIQRQFLRLQQSLEINNPPQPGQLNSGPRPKQDRAKALADARTRLYNLFTQPTLDEAEIRQAILDFEDLDPQHWPHPDDYRDILSVMLGEKSAEEVSV